MLSTLCCSLRKEVAHDCETEANGPVKFASSRPGDLEASSEKVYELATAMNAWKTLDSKQFFIFSAWPVDLLFSLPSRCRLAT